jgi:hypothetical protein
VKNIIGEMMAQRVQTPEGIIQGMGYPGKRVPVPRSEIEEHPSEKD